MKTVVVYQDNSEYSRQVSDYLRDLTGKLATSWKRSTQRQGTALTFAGHTILSNTQVSSR